MLIKKNPPQLAMVICLRRLLEARTSDFGLELMTLGTLPTYLPKGGMEVGTKIEG